MDRVDPTWPQHWPDLGSTSASKAPNLDQLAPTSAQLGTTWPQLGLIWEQGPYGFKMGDIAGPIRNPQSARLHWYLFPCFFAIDNALIEAIFSRCVSSGPQLGVKLSPKVPSCCMLELTRTFMCITCFNLESVWIALGPTPIGAFRSAREMPPHRTKLRMLSPTCVQTCPSCAMLGPKLEPSGPSSAEVRPKLGPSGPCSAQLKAKDGRV